MTANIDKKYEEGILKAIPLGKLWSSVAWALQDPAHAANWAILLFFMSAALWLQVAMASQRRLLGS